MSSKSFEDYAIVACGTLIPELNHLRDGGFLNAKKILYTLPGGHEDPQELEKHLIRQLTTAKKYSQRIIVVYGGRFCYFNIDDPSRTIDTIIQEQGTGISRIEASRCFDMLASDGEREQISEQIAGGRKVYWLTPGWLRYRKYVFQDWDKAMANENFERGGVAILLDGIDFWDRYMEENPEDLLDFSDWIGIPIEPYKVSLDRLKSLLLEQMQQLRG